MDGGAHEKETPLAIWWPQKIVRFIIEDWIFLIALGFTVALLSLGMETCIIELQALRRILMKWVQMTDKGMIGVNINILEFVVWVGYTTVLVLSAAILTRYIATHAIGSGIPEMKTILRGVMLKEYLSLRTLIAKMVGLTLAIGSGLPIGKEGPFAHVGSIVANLFSRLVKSFQPIYANESRSCELIAAGCAVGVACTFSAPIGGVLFSIEVTAVYFAVRDYWRGFFAAACSSIVFSLLRLYIQSSEVTVVAFYQTSFKHRSFLPEELLFFAFIGIFCGITGAMFILIHRRLVLFFSSNRFMKIIYKDYWLIYPLILSVLHAFIRYSRFLGQFMSGETVFNHKLWDFFKNCTWSANISSPFACPSDLIHRWTGLNGEYSIFMELSMFVVVFYFMCIFCVMLPIPAGIFMPVFVVGAAIGRLFGEVISVIFPSGIRGEIAQVFISPGIYSVVGAAAFCGAVTQTVSVAIITFEMTGQLLHIVPVMIAVIISNIICSALQPSFFDSLIMIKQLPYLPEIPKSASAVHAIQVEQIMVYPVISLSKTSTYRDIKRLLDNELNLPSFPVVNDYESMILIGSVGRKTIENALNIHIGKEAKRRDILKQSKFKDIKRLRTKSLNCLTNSVANNESNECYQKSNVHLNYGMIIDESFDDDGDDDNNKHHQTTKHQSPRFNSLHFTHKSLMNSSDSLDHHNDHRNKNLSRCRQHSFSGMVHNLAHTLHLDHENSNKSNVELVGEEQKKWLERQLNKRIDFSLIVVDDAPFQLVEKSSLYKVHSLFSLLAVNRAYVTRNGVLIGVVSLRELRLGIRLAQNGGFGLSKRLASLDQQRSADPASTIENANAESETNSSDSRKALINEQCNLGAELMKEVEIGSFTNQTMQLDSVEEDNMMDSSKKQTTNSGYELDPCSTMDKVDVHSICSKIRSRSNTPSTK